VSGRFSFLVWKVGGRKAIFHARSSNHAARSQLGVKRAVYSADDMGTIMKSDDEVNNAPADSNGRKIKLLFTTVH